MTRQFDRRFMTKLHESFITYVRKLMMRSFWLHIEVEKTLPQQAMAVPRRLHEMPNQVQEITNRILFQSTTCRLQPAKKSQITPIACPVVKKSSHPHDSSEHSTNADHRAEYLQQRRRQRQPQEQTSLALSATTCVVKLTRPPVPPISHPSSHLRAPRAAGRPAHVSKIITSFSVYSSEAHTATHESN